MTKEQKARFSASARVAELQEQQRMLPIMIEKLVTQLSLVTDRVDKMRFRVQFEQRREVDLTALVGAGAAAMLLWIVNHAALARYSLAVPVQVLLTALGYLTPAVLFFAGSRMVGFKRVVAMVTAVAIFAAVVTRLAVDFQQTAMKPSVPFESAVAFYAAVALASTAMLVLFLEQLWFAYPAAWRRFQFSRQLRRAETIERELTVAAAHLRDLPRLIEAATAAQRAADECYGAVDRLTA